jgi:CheY-like chemotaxis protein
LKLRMPTMRYMLGTDGLTLIANIREAHPAMPIALITANTQDGTIARAAAWCGVRTEAGRGTSDRCISIRCSAPLRKPAP